MENKFVRVPFNVEMAKKIQSGEIEGRIITRDGRSARIVCWDLKYESYPILALIDNGDKEVVWVYHNNGLYNTEVEDKTDLFLDVPEYMTFKDEDIVTLGWKDSEESYCSWISVIQKIKIDDYNIKTCDYVTMYLESSDTDLLKSGPEFDTYSETAKWVRKATEEEKQKLIEALKRSDSPKVKEYLKRFFGIDIPQDSNSSQIGKNYEFKPFDKVLVRNSINNIWKCNLFSHYIKADLFSYVCVGGLYKYCLPYNEKTAHLIGTSDDWVEDKKQTIIEL